MTPEEQLIQRYFAAFNRHDVEGVMACFHENPVIIDTEGRRFAGRVEVRRSYETSFALFPDGRCDLWSCTGNDGRGMAESLSMAPGRGKGKWWRRSAPRSWRSWTARSKRSAITIALSQPRRHNRRVLSLTVKASAEGARALHDRAGKFFPHPP
jgi:hypothetical protein